MDNKTHPHSVIFMCCGQGSTEISILESLQKREINIIDEIFFDKIITNRCVTNVTQYSNKYHQIGQHGCTKIVSSFKCLTKYIVESKIKDHKWIVLGINASFTFETAKEIYSSHLFFSKLSRAANNKELHLNWTNILKNKPGQFPHHRRLPLHENIRIYSCPWWEFATSLISDKHAEHILMKY